METDNVKKSRINIRTIIEIILVLIIAALAFICFYEANEKVGTANVYYYTPEKTITDGPYDIGSVAKLIEAPQIDGYNFLGWRDEQGNIEKRTEIYVNEDTYFSAVYSVAFDTDEHMVYLENDNGLFRPMDGITRAETVKMFYALLNTGTVGKGEFEDIGEKDDCYDAAATLKDLGVISGSYFHPDDVVSRAEFSEMLSCFCPDYKDYMDDCESESPMLRYEVAVVMSKILGREGDSKNNQDAVGTFLDVSPKSDYFWAVAEATIPHEYTVSSNKEVWTTSQSLEKYEPGIFFVNGALHYIDEDGNPALDATVDWMQFNSRGEITSGDDELDILLQQIIKENCDTENMSQSEMLKVLYKFVSDQNNYKYLTRNIYEMGDESWMEQEAKTMIKTGKGNCYNYAAVFYELARAIGYEAKAISGTMGIDVRPHAWVEIEKNGEMMLYDVEYQFVHPELNCYQRDSAYKEKYHYHTIEDKTD